MRERRRHFKGNGRGYTAVDYENLDEPDPAEEIPNDAVYHQGSWDDHDEDGYWEGDDPYYDEDGSHFDDDAVYYQQLEEPAVDMPYVEEYDEAYAAYMWMLGNASMTSSFRGAICPLLLSQRVSPIWLLG